MKSTFIYVFAKWQVKEGELDTVRELLLEVIEKSIKEEGNLFYKVLQSHSDTHLLVLFEGYRDETSLEVHRNSTHYQDLVIGKIVPRLEKREVILTSDIHLDPRGTASHLNFVNN